jgi:glycine/D-amino acid oxidase-like deaminating enzyme
VTSLWRDRPDVIADDPLDVDEDLDTVVIGAGLTGLVTALMLAEAGQRVAVLEGRTVGAVATGNTTAKVSLLQGTTLSSILRYQSEHVARAYVDGNRAGQEWLLQFCADHDVPVQTRDAVTYAAKPDELGAVRREFDAALSVGLDVHWSDTLDVPFPSHGAVVLPAQAQFDPMDVLTALSSRLRQLGGSIHQHRRVVKASFGGRPGVTLDDGSTVHADSIVLATG